MLRWTNLFKGVYRLFQSRDLNANDIVVFVVGPSGGGKSWFINAATKSALVSVSKNLEPCTKDVQAIRCELTDRAKMAFKLDANSTQKSIVFVDMPSFLTGHENGAEKKVTKWLKNLRYASTLVGTIYVARVETNPANKPTEVQDHLNTFARAFPQHVKDIPSRLLAVLSYESNMSQNKIDYHKEEFEKQVNALRASVFDGRQLAWRAAFHHDLFRDGSGDLASNIAWKVVEKLLCARQE